MIGLYPFGVICMAAIVVPLYLGVTTKHTSKGVQVIAMLLLLWPLVLLYMGLEVLFYNLNKEDVDE